MNILRKIATNSGLLLINKVISNVISIFVAIYLIRYLGSEGYGKFSIVFAYLSFFQILTGLGIDTIVIREVSKDNSKQNLLIGNAILMKPVFSFFAILISWAILQFMGYSSEVRIFIYVASLSMIFSFSSLYIGLFQAHFKVAYYAIPEVVVNLVFSGLKLLLIFLRASIIHFVLLKTIQIIPLTIIYIYFSKNVSEFKPYFKVDLNIWKELLRHSWPIFFSSVFVSIFTRIDQIMLFNMMGDKSLGLYASIVKLTENLNIIPGVFMISVFPLLSSTFVKSHNRFVKVYNLSFKYMSIIIIPIAFGTTLLSERLISLIYGSDFIQASGALSILIWSEIFVFLGAVNAGVFTSAEMQKYIFLFTAIGAFMNVILNLILIPKYGIVGASIATVVSYGFTPALIIQYSIKELRQFLKDYIKSTFKPILCSIPMSVFIYFCRSFNIFILILFSIIIYFVAVVIFKGLDREDLGYFKQIIGKRAIAQEPPK